MNRIHHLPTTGRSLRFTQSPESLLEDIASGDLLYVYHRNIVCELAAILPLGNLVFDRSQQLAMFPENGMALSLKSVDFIHGVTVKHQDSLAYALEFAIRGEPRSACIAAIPDISDIKRFGMAIGRHPSVILPAEEFKLWQKNATLPQSICPCCAHDAAQRRNEPERHPLTHLFSHAMGRGLSLYCSIESPHMTLSRWIEPRDLHTHSGILGVVSSDERGLLEIDLGLVHSLYIRRRRIDGEDFATVQLYDSVGKLHFTIAAREPGIETIWRGFCHID